MLCRELGQDCELEDGVSPGTTVGQDWESPSSALPTSGLESVADPGIGKDVSGSCFGLDLFSQLIDEHTEIFGLLHTLGSPHCVEQHAMSEHLVGMTRHEHQQVKF